MQFWGSQVGAGVVVGVAIVVAVVITDFLDVLAIVMNVDRVLVIAVLATVVRTEALEGLELAAGWLHEPPSSRFWLEFEQEASS